MSSPPTKYTRQADFTDHSTVHPDEPQSGIDLDSEFDLLKTVTDKVIDRLAEIQRSDGPLKNGIVTRDSLAADITLGFAAPTPWATGQAYVANYSTVFDDAKFWLCITSHTSGASFAGDAAKWSLIADLGSGATDAAASAVQAGISAAAALASQNAAHASELAAAASAAAAAAFDSSLYLTKADNLNSVASKSTARGNLGLGTAAVSDFTLSNADPSGTPTKPTLWVKV